jgi:hypothetical protein
LLAERARWDFAGTKGQTQRRAEEGQRERSRTES